MNSFTISQLQRYSGINVHSIRAWEKRYNALKPGRSEGNTRNYNGDQLRRLLNIASLMNSEYKISELCSLPDSKLHELTISKLEAVAKNSDSDEFLISQMVASALAFDEPFFDKVFSRSIINHGLEGTYLKVLYPALQRIGMLWSADRIAPAQEHFISNLIRQKLNSSIDNLPLSNRSANHWLLFLPENEFHETGLLMANYLIRNAGQSSTYLGANVPVDTVKDAVKIVKPTSVLFFLVSKDDEEQDKKLIKLLQKNLPSLKIFIATHANRFSNFPAHKNLEWLTSAEDLKKVLAKLSEK